MVIALMTLFDALSPAPIDMPDPESADGEISQKAEYNGADSATG